VGGGDPGRTLRGQSAKESRSAFFRIDDRPTQFHEGVNTDITPPSLPSALVDAGKGRLWRSALAFAPVKNDPHITPVLKLATQLFVPVQTTTGYYEEEHLYVPAGRSVTAEGWPSRQGIVANLKRARSLSTRMRQPGLKFSE
jgi:hypothetical protein